MKKNKGFTLIELLAVIVILAILALIAIPIVIQIIKDSRENSYKRSIEAYGRNVENAMATWQTKNDGEAPMKLSSYDIKMSGNKVKCDDDTITAGENESIILHQCYVLDNKGNRKSDLYKYEKRKATKEGESDNDSSSSNNYQEYSIGDYITVNGKGYHVIANSDSKQDYVVALKDKALTVDEVNDNRIGTDGINHANKNTYNSNGEAQNADGYGYVAYYSGDGCGYENGSWVDFNCVNDYDSSDIIHIVNNWSENYFQNNELKNVNGYKSRLISFEEANIIGWKNCNSADSRCNLEDDAPSWLLFSWDYWTMSPQDNTSSQVWRIDSNGFFVTITVHGGGAVRPVINIYKSAIK